MLVGLRKTTITQETKFYVFDLHCVNEINKQKSLGEKTPNNGCLWVVKLI